jgi:hypothetical protein
MSSTLNDLAKAAAEASVEEKQNDNDKQEDEDGKDDEDGEDGEDGEDDDSYPDPDYDQGGFIWFHEERKLFQNKVACAACSQCCLKDLEGGVPSPPATSRCRMCGFAAHSSCLLFFEPPLYEQRELRVCKSCTRRTDFNTLPHRRSIKIVNDDHAKEIISDMHCFSYSLELVPPTKFKSLCDDIDDGLFDDSARNGKLHMLGCLVFMYPISNFYFLFFITENDDDASDSSENRSSSSSGSGEEEEIEEEEQGKKQKTHDDGNDKNDDKEDDAAAED